MSAIANFVAELLVGVVTGVINLVLERVFSARPRSHGSSRWAGRFDRRRLGRSRPPELAVGDGIALGFLGSQLLQCLWHVAIPSSLVRQDQSIRD